MDTECSIEDLRSQRSLAVSLSGGGHRATIFGLGVLMYLVDSGANGHVTSVASVSGGSLTNGFVGQVVDFRATDGATFSEQVTTPLATQIARSGTLFKPVLTKIYLTILIVCSILTLLVPWWVSGPWYLRVALFLIGLTLSGWLFGRRGVVCAHAFQKTLFSRAGVATPLSAVKNKYLDHVICATELRSAQQVYFSSDFVYSYLLGHGGPGELVLARAVQASASFPGGFPAAHLQTKRHAFSGAPAQNGGTRNTPKEMVLTDGGVYDNMGDQWARGFAERLKRWPELGKDRSAPTQLVVVNASARVPWTPFRLGLIPIVSEIALLARVNSVMYINTTNVRRQEIVRSFDPTQLKLSDASVLPSALVQIAQSPFTVAEFFAKGAGPAADRGREVIEMLGKESWQEWAQLVQKNAKVPTTLSRLGAEVCAQLLYQAYVVAMCNLYVIFGDEFPLLPGNVTYERYRELIR